MWFMSNISFDSHRRLICSVLRWRPHRQSTCILFSCLVWFLSSQVSACVQEAFGALYLSSKWECIIVVLVAPGRQVHPWSNSRQPLPPRVVLVWVSWRECSQIILCLFVCGGGLRNGVLNVPNPSYMGHRYLAFLVAKTNVHVIAHLLSHLTWSSFQQSLDLHILWGSNEPHSFQNIYLNLECRAWWVIELRLAMACWHGPITTCLVYGAPCWQTFRCCITPTNYQQTLKWPSFVFVGSGVPRGTSSIA